MSKQIIKIDEELCIGCGLCAEACQEGAIQMIDGKAKMVREDYCDGLGNCLPVCPVGAISFEERKADEGPQDEKSGAAGKAAQNTNLACGCPGTSSRKLDRGPQTQTTASEQHGSVDTQSMQSIQSMQSMLGQWPVQIKLVPVNAPYFDGANLLIAADCTAYSYGDFHRKFMKRRITLIGCPKLDEGDYAEKLTAIIARNNIKSVTVVRMEVPCCGGIENAVKRALSASGKMIPWQIVTISTDGEIIE